MEEGKSSVVGDIEQPNECSLFLIKTRPFITVKTGTEGLLQGTCACGELPKLPNKKIALDYSLKFLSTSLLNSK